jgi:hypothetical protein
MHPLNAVLGECVDDYASVDDEAAPFNAVGLAPLTTSHNMRANSPNIAGWGMRKTLP